MEDRFKDIIEDCPVIAAVKDMDSLEQCFATDIQMVFILFGDICNIGRIVDRVKEQGKIVLVHLDLIEGLASKEIAVDYIRQMTRADGIISTKTVQINRAKELGLYAVYRFFAIDSRSFGTIQRQCAQARPDCIEILPGVMPHVIERIVKEQRIPVIAGGMVSKKREILEALQAGATSVSTTRRELWKM